MNTNIHNHLTPDEITSVLNTVIKISQHPERDLLFLQVLRETGATIGAISLLTPEKIGTRSIALPGADRWEVYTVSEELCHSLRSYSIQNSIVTGGCVFTSNRNKTPIKRWYIWWLVKKAAAIADVRRFDGAGEYVPVSPIMIRLGGEHD